MKPSTVQTGKFKQELLSLFVEKMLG